MIVGDETGELSFLPTAVESTEATGEMYVENQRTSGPVMADVSSGYYASIWHGGFPDEPSLLEEMGIHNTNVVSNLKVILMPTSRVKTVDDNFLLGMMFFCLFGGSLLLLGKVRFGMVYMIGLVGFTLIYYVIKYMSPNPVTIAQLFTALSYCTIPLAPAVLIEGIFKMNGMKMIIFSIPFIAWAAYSCTRYLMFHIRSDELTPLIFAPLFLFYSYLLLLPLF